MREWFRGPNSTRLVRLSTLALTQPLDTMENNVSLQDRFYPIRTSLPSAFFFLNQMEITLS